MREKKRPVVCRLDQLPAEQAAFLRPGGTIPLRPRRGDSIYYCCTRETSRLARLTSTRGFSLIEMMIAMTLFAIVSLGVYPLMWNNIVANSKNGLRKEAETVAVRWMDTLSARGYNGLASVAETADPVDSNFTYQVAVTTNAANDRKEILLTIRWSLGNTGYNYSVQTIKVRNS